jgi:hypothetical protein
MAELSGGPDLELPSPARPERRRSAIISPVGKVELDRVIVGPVEAMVPE